MSSYVGLNVGGKIYRTSRTTLTREPDSFFTSLLSDSFSSEKDEQGNYLIDGDGKIFRHILNYMRYGKLVLPDGFNEYGLLRCQADFFQLESLKLELKGIHHGNVNEFVGFNVRKKEGDNIFHLERESLMRDPDSYFAERIQDEFAPMDAHGNFIIDTSSCFNLGYFDLGAFADILHYLRSGDICKLLSSSSSSLYNRVQQARVFRLKVSDDIFKELDKVNDITRKSSLNDTLCGTMFCFPSNDHFLFIVPELVPGIFFKNSFHMTCLRSNDGKLIGFKAAQCYLHSFRFNLKDMPNSDKQDKVLINGIERTFSYPNNEEELIEYISERTGAARTIRTELSIGCTKIEFRYDNQTTIEPLQ